MTGTFAAAGYSLTLLAFGTVSAVYVLRMRDVLAIAGMAITFGTAAYLVTANAFAYIVGTPAAFGSALLTLSCFTAFILLVAWSAEGLRIVRAEFVVPPRGVMLSLLGIALLGGLMGARFLGSDPHAAIHFPLAATIAEGNFPVAEVTNPWNRLGYHYGPAFLAAAWSRLTGSSLQAGYGFQPLLGIVGILLFATALGWRITRSWRAAFLGAVLALFGGGIAWVKLTWVFADLANVATGAPIAAPLRNLVPSFSSSIVTPVIAAVGWRTIATGTPILFCLLWCLHETLRENEVRRLLFWGSTCIVLAAALALTMEGTFVLLFPAIIAFIAIALLLRLPPMEGAVMRSWHCKILLYGGILLFSLTIARLQGGTLSAGGSDVNAASFAFWFNGKTEYHTWGKTVGFWEWPFLRDFGLPLILLPFIAVDVWRRRLRSPFVLFLLILSIGHLVAPFVVHYRTLPGELKRLFPIATSLLSMLTGWMIAQILLEDRARTTRAVGWGLFAAMTITGILAALTRLLFPTFRFETEPLFARMPAVTAEEAALHAWVKAHSTIDDYFYLYSLAEPREDVPNMLKSEQADRIRFMTFTGRFTIGAILSHLSMSEERAAQIRRFERTCSAAAAEVLRIRYLVAHTSERAMWFRDRCDPHAWEIIYEGIPGQPSPRIYERKPIVRAT